MAFASQAQHVCNLRIGRTFLQGLLKEMIAVAVKQPLARLYQGEVNQPIKAAFMQPQTCCILKPARGSLEMTFFERLQASKKLTLLEWLVQLPSCSQVRSQSLPTLDGVVGFIVLEM